ncbi:transglycosylase domain-containing protein [Aedoeadaptatus coxii]|nr:transglycosylase domain-containing protein [Peptoniphilus coxii]
MSHHFKNHSNTIHLALCIIAFIVVFIAGMLGAWVVTVLHSVDAIDFNDLKVSIAETSTILDAEGNIIDEVDPSIISEHVALKQVPKHVQEAFLAIEDRSFYDHHGLDLRQILASLAANVKSGHIIRGGSTITQQLVKNIYLSTDQSVARKLKEAYITLALEQSLSKKDILEAYLNRVDLGLGSQGIEAASQAYFSKHVEDLTLEEGALLAGIAKSPANYQPLKRLPASDEKNENIVATQTVGDKVYDLEKNERSMERKNTVLKAMAAGGYLSSKEADDASKRDIIFKPKQEDPAPYSSYVADYIADEAIQILMTTQKIDRDRARQLVREGGLTIQSTIVPQYQKGMETLYDGYAHLVQNGRNRGAHFIDFSTDESGNIVDDRGETLYLRYGNLFDEEGNLHLSKEHYRFENGNLSFYNPAFVQKNGTIQLKNFYTLDKRDNLKTLSGATAIFEPGEVSGDEEFEMSKDVLKKYGNSIKEQDGELIFSKNLFLFPDESSLQPQSAALIADNETGGIVALAGGNSLRNPARMRFNHVNSKRQPGTALTPLSAYLTALIKGDTLATSYDDTPLKIDGAIWPAQREFYGYDILADAAAHTREAVGGKILERFGFEASLNTLKLLGLYDDTSNDTIVSSSENKTRNDITYDGLASGNLVDGVSLKDLVNAYAKIASPQTGGNYIVESITDGEGNVIYRHEPKSVKFPNKSNALLRYALSLSPLSKSLKQNGYDAYAIFGENKFHSDYMAVGSTPHYTYGLWMGNEIQKLALSRNQDLATSFYASLYSITDDKSQWKVPDSFEMVEVSDKTGDLASTYAKRAHSTVTLPFLPGTAPKEITKNYTRVLICSESGEKASTYCPYDTITYGYYFVRPKGYDPAQFDGIRPKDFYTLPSSYCHIHTKEWHDEQLRQQEELEKEQEEALKKEQAKARDKQKQKSKNNRSATQKTAKGRKNSKR